VGGFRGEFLYGVVEDVPGTVIFNWHVGNDQVPTISGIAVEFYLPP
jgi:hypothetical protein